MKYELDAKITTVCCIENKNKQNSTDDNNENEEAKGTKKVCHKT